MINIQFNKIQANSFSKNTAVFLGQNSIFSWNSHFKGNSNVAHQFEAAQSNTSNSLNIIEDIDGFDMPVLSRQLARKNPTKELGIDNTQAPQPINHKKEDELL